MKRFLSLALCFTMLFALVPFAVCNVSAAEQKVFVDLVEYRLSYDGTYYSLYDCKSTATEIIILSEIDGIPVTTVGGLGGGLSYLENLESVIIPNSVTTIAASAFTGCDSLKTIEIPSSVTSIAQYAFSECENLESIVIPNSVTAIANFTFFKCPNLKEVTISETVTYIGNKAFYKCTSLESIIIPKAVETTGYNVFEGCTNLKDIYCEAPSQPDGWDYTWNREYDWNIQEEVPIPATVHWNYGSIMLGDVNANGKIDMADYVLLKRAYFGTYNFTEEQNIAGDINKNGKIDMSDYVLLKRAYFGTYVIK